jgi:hypothetical protein
MDCDEEVPHKVNVIIIIIILPTSGGTEASAIRNWGKVLLCPELRHLCVQHNRL